MKFHVWSGLIVLLLATTGFAHAQGQRKNQSLTPEERAGKISQRMKHNLGLSDDQTDKVYQWVLSSEMDTKQRREALRQRREERDKELSEILSPEQYQKYSSQKEQWRSQRMKQRNSGSNGNNSEMNQNPPSEEGTSPPKEY